mgnify:CR=1 FL=1|jgi:hypothetical protein
MQPTDIKIRCSSLGYIMTDPRSKSEVLSETCKGHLADIMVQHKYGRIPDIQTKYTIKGNMVEEDSITLFSRVTKKMFRKNEENIKNDYITGTPDLFTGESIYSAETIIDIKSSWDIFTFFRQHENSLNKAYYYQLQGYMWLTGAKSSMLAYCLVNTPDSLIYDEQRKLMYKMNAATSESPEFLKASEELEKSLKFDDIPLKERLITIQIDRDDETIDRIKERVMACREYMAAKYPALFEPSIILASHDSEVNATIVEQG